MPFVPVQNVALVETRCTLDFQQVENTLYFRFPAIPGSSVLTTLGNEVLTWWQNVFAPLVSSALVLREVVVTDLSSATGPQVTVVPTGLLQGGNLIGPIANSNTLTVSFRTANRGRSFRGRNYVLGLSSSDLSGANNIKGTTITALVTAYEGLFDVADNASAVWVVVSRFSGVDASGKPVPRVTGISTDITTVVVVDDVLDNQRRRLPKRGK